MRCCILLALILFTAPVSAADRLVLVAGSGTGGDGSPANQARLVQPFGVDFAPDGTPYFVEMSKGERLRHVTARGLVQTLAGTGEKGAAGDGGPGMKATFNGMHSLAVGPDGCIYLADTWNNRVRKYDPKSGMVTTFAGTGEKGFGGDGGPALKAKFGGCYCVSFDPAGKNLFITDLGNHRIRKVELATGCVTTVAGNGKKGVPQDGAQATSQPLVDPRAHTVDAKGNLYVLERDGHALRVVGIDGTIRTVAGTGKAGMGSGRARTSALNGPKHLSIDRDGSVLIADTENHRIVRYIPDQEQIVPIAGTGKKGNTGVGGDPLKAELNQPHGIIPHPKTGELFISDASNNRVLKIVKE